MSDTTEAAEMGTRSAAQNRPMQEFLRDPAGRDLEHTVARASRPPSASGTKTC